jgi:Serine/threonine protein phosphatase
MVQVGFKSDKGKKRVNNEDSLFVMPEQRIYMVADGVGGHNAGELASMTAVKNVAEYIVANPINKVINEEGLKNYFLSCLREVNNTIFHLASSSKNNIGMATTLVLLYLTNQKAYFVNIGDSRAYVIRDGHISQITEDHTYVNELVKEGSITKAQAEIHPQKNMITRALGGEDKIIPDFYQLEIQKNDVIILCSDGLHNEVSSADICRMASEIISMSELSANLVRSANHNGGNDNITVVSLKI